MARTLTFSLDGHEFSARLVKVDRDRLYGTIEIEAFDEHGHEAVLRVLAADGKTLIDKGGTALATINEKGESIDRRSLVAVDSEGDEIEPVSSSFSGTNILKKAETDDYLSQIVKSVYLLEEDEDSDLDFLHSHLAGGQQYKFPFSYRGGVEYDNAFVIGHKGDAFMVVGTQATFQFLKLNQPAALDSNEEQEISADDLDFEFI